MGVAKLNGKSMAKRETQGTADLPEGKAIKKKRKSKDEEPRSSVSQRTRSKFGVKRNAEVSAFLDECETTMDSTRPEAGSLLGDTLSFSEDAVWLGEARWMRTMKDLDETVEKVDIALEESEGVLKAVESIKEREIVPEIVDITGEKEERVNRKKVTFKVGFEGSNIVIEEVMQLLEVVAKAGIENAPRTQIERIIRILVAICIDLYSRMQYAQRTISTTAELLQEYMEKEEEMEERKRNEEQLKREITKLKEQKA